MKKWLYIFFPSDDAQLSIVYLDVSQYTVDLSILVTVDIVIRDRNTIQTSLGKKRVIGLKSTRTSHIIKPSEGQRRVWV